MFMDLTSERGSLCLSQEPIDEHLLHEVGRIGGKKPSRGGPSPMKGNDEHRAVGPSSRRWLTLAQPHVAAQKGQSSERQDIFLSTR